MMDPIYLDLLKRALGNRGIETAPGLSEDELAAIESDFGFRFPDDLRELLASFLPLGDDLPDWRSRNQHLLEWLDFPAEGVAFDVEENDFWCGAWGERPEDPDDAVEEARRQVALAPILIPVYGHAFLPARPSSAGNPVFSVVQTEVSLAGSDLGWFLYEELSAPRPDWSPKQPRTIDFWSDLLAPKHPPEAE